MANLKDLIVNGASRFIGKVFINNSTIGVINNSTVGDYPKFTDTTYAQVTTAAAGLSPKLSGSATQYLNGAGNWTTPTNTTYADVTTAAHGLLTAADKIKLNALTTADATTSAHGYLTAADKIKLNALSTVDNNTTYGLVTTATDGLVRKLNNTATQYLNGQGNWATPPNTTYADATTAAHGLLTAADKIKLNSIAASATRNTFSAFTGAPTSNQTPSFGGTFNIYQVGQTTAGAITTTTRTVTIPNTAATTAASGLMSTYDKKILAGLTTSIGRAGYYYGGTAQSAMPIYFNATNGFKELDGNYIFVEKAYDQSEDGTDFNLFRAGSILWFNNADTTSSLSNSPGAYHGFCITLGSHSGYDTASRISQFFVIYDNTDSLNTIFYRSCNTGWSSWLNFIPQIQTTTWSTPTISSSNITITSGGYYKEGKHVYVQMQGATAKTLSANTVTTVATGLPSISGAPLAVLSITIGNKSDGYTAQVTTAGALRFRATASVASGQTYNITGMYTIA